MEPRDRGLERLSLDEPHDVIRPAGGIAPQTIDGNDSRVLEPSGDLRLENEPRLADRVMGMISLEHLESDLTIELGIDCQKDLAEPAAGMRPQNRKPRQGRSPAHPIWAAELFTAACHASTELDP